MSELGKFLLRRMAAKSELGKFLLRRMAAKSELEHMLVYFAAALFFALLALVLVMLFYPNYAFIM